MQNMNLTESKPLASCIMPTYDRRRFVPQANKYFLRQGYSNKELIILHDGAKTFSELEKRPR